MCPNTLIGAASPSRSKSRLNIKIIVLKMPKKDMKSKNNWKLKKRRKLSTRCTVMSLRIPLSTFKGRRLEKHWSRHTTTDALKL